MLGVRNVKTPVATIIAFSQGKDVNENLKRGTVIVAPVGDGQTTAFTDSVDDHEELIWDSIFIHFDVSVFIHQLVLHLFLPLTVWMSPCAKCQLFAWDKNCTFASKVGMVLVHFANVTSFVSFIFYMTMDVRDRDHFFGSLAYPLVFMLLWKLSVAVKYASFSPSEYKRYMTFKSWDRVGAFLAQTLINQNLIATQNDHVNRFEIAAGAHRSGLKNVHLLHFKLENPDNSEHARRRLLEWDAFLRKSTPVLLDRNAPATASDKHGAGAGAGAGSERVHDGLDGLHFDLHRQADGSYTLLLFDLCRHIQQWSQAQSVAVLHGKLILLGRMAVFVVALIPFFDLINQSYTVSTNNARAIVFLAFTTFDAVFFLSTVLVGFLNGAIIDFRRQYEIQKTFNQLIRLHDADDEVRFATDAHWGRMKSEGVRENDWETRNALSHRLDEHTVHIFHKMHKTEAIKRQRKDEIKSLLQSIKEEHDHAVAATAAAELRPLDTFDDDKMTVHAVDEYKQSGDHKGAATAAAAAVSPGPPRKASLLTASQRVHVTSHATSQIFDVEAAVDHAREARRRSVQMGTVHEHDRESTDFKGRDSEPLGMPRLSFDYEQNILCWVQARQVMTTFKLRFRRRIEAVALMVFLSTVGMIISCLYTIYTTPNIQDAYSHPLVLQTIVVVTVFAISLIKYTQEASIVNVMFDAHKMSIVAHQMAVQNRLTALRNNVNACGWGRGSFKGASDSDPEATAAACDRLESRSMALDACLKYVDICNTNHPCEIFGVRADARQILSVLSGLVTFYVTLISIYYSNGKSYKLGGE